MSDETFTIEDLVSGSEEVEQKDDAPKGREPMGALRRTGLVFFDLLVTIGVIGFMFIAWQLWWTDIESYAYQDKVIEKYQDPRVGKYHVADPRFDEPPVPETKGMDNIWGLVYIPRFDRDTFPIAEGVSIPKVLNVKGAGHYPDTVMPGQVGNFAFAGHRTTYGRPLHEIHELEKGHSIVVETDEYYYVYSVDSSHIIDPDQIEVIAPVPGDKTFAEKPTERRITMTACHPLYSARERYITYGTFEYYTVKSEGIPPALAPDANDGIGVDSQGKVTVKRDGVWPNE